jgi:hypothetical protein
MKLMAILVPAACAVAACRPALVSASGDAGADTGGGAQDQLDQILASRTTDYGAALRTAALRLLGDLPTMTEIEAIATAPDDAGKRLAYEAALRDYVGRPAFARQMLAFWRDTFKTGGAPELDTAPAFAARLAVDNASYMELFTRSTANCPSFDGSTFTDAECGNGGPQVGVLSNPGLLAQFSSHLAFRRVRFVQEVFGCAAFPVETTGAPIDVGGAALYHGAWPFGSIASPGNGGGRIDFLDATTAVCADCHETMNHQAPLFANYDDHGVYGDAIAVSLPLDGSPLARMTDWLPPGEVPAWRYQQPTPDLPAFGAAMAADPDVAACAVARLWNWALGKADVVDARQIVPLPTIQAQLDAFTRNGFRVRDLILGIFDADDFVKF